jgi:hypothetical protein
LGHRLAVAGDDHGLAFLNQLEEPGKLGLGLVYVHLHRESLVQLFS